MRICAIVLAAGKGARLKSKVSKPLVLLGRRPVLAYSLRLMAACPRVYSVIVAASRSNRRAVERCVAASRLKKPVIVVNGGARRQDSVRNALRRIPRECGYVLVHDAARPFADARCLARLIRGVVATGAVIPAVPVKSTIKEVSPRSPGACGIVRRTLERSMLREVQTPQLFRKDIIVRAYQRHGARAATDDAGLVEKLGVPVAVVAGSYDNIKITTPEDLRAVRALLRARSIR